MDIVKQTTTEAEGPYGRYRITNSLIEFMPCENAEAEEQRLLNEYKLRNNTFPLANWKL